MDSQLYSPIPCHGNSHEIVLHLSTNHQSSLWNSYRCAKIWSALFHTNHSSMNLVPCSPAGNHYLPLISIGCHFLVRLSLVLPPATPLVHPTFSFNHFRCCKIFHFLSPHHMASESWHTCLHYLLISILMSNHIVCAFHNPIKFDSLYYPWVLWHFP